MTNWIKRWEDGKIGWHRDVVNSRLVKFYSCIDSANSVFVPLCGKSADMLFFLDKGVSVIGVELSSMAVEQFFVENNLKYRVEIVGKFKIYTAKNIVIYCGDYFDLESKHLSNIGAVYDRASLVALESDLRAKYVKHLYSIIPMACRVLLLTLNYPQDKLSGPPFAVNKAEVGKLFNGFEYQLLECINDIENEPKFQHAGAEYIEKATYCLQKK